MKNFANPDGLVREDFRGGWAEDKVNKFESSGRTEREEEAFRFVRTLANYRKNNPVLQTGRLMQFVPENGVYTYFRYNDDKSVMVVMNTNDKPEKVATDRYAERMQGFTGAKDVITGKQVTSVSALEIPAKSTVVLELTR